MIKKLRALGFTGPENGSRHPYMEKDDFVLTVPNDHGVDIGPELQNQLIRRLGIDRSEWINL